MTEAAPIDAMPTKQFFVDMLIRDIPLERAVLDLVDNCIDGAKRLREPAELDFSGLWVKIVLNEQSFVIEDNCGGFDIATARDYAFRFGRPKEARVTPFSIGQFGVGMKRALFKFGREFSILSKTQDESWSVKVNVDLWENGPSWTFDFLTSDTNAKIPESEWGTKIEVSRLRPEVSSRFSTQWFQNQLSELIRVHQRQFIAKGLEIRLGGVALTAVDLNFLTGTVTPSLEEYEEVFDGVTVKVKIVAGVGYSSPQTSGWYVVCNGRVVIAADRSGETGWGRATPDNRDVPKFHNQFARFRGIIYFDCTSAELLPWNTTKTGIDADSPLWQRALEKMITSTRTVIDFLNDLDNEASDQGSAGPLSKALASATPIQADRVTQKATFKAPDKEKFSGPVMKRITYSRPEAQLLSLMTALGLSTAKAVGEQTFDTVYRDKVI
ncbi:ATP-binding protein [Mesorhizobium sp. M0152]|uniref:ATP-binding protein n=1 Tax=Mesorhizobium sp. M0152 TaxID=2956898 RepID=UPI0033352C10